MKGQRKETYNPEIGLAMMGTREIQQKIGPPPHTAETVGAFMGVSRQRVSEEERKILRKLRIRLMRQPQVWQALVDHVHKI